MRILAAIAFVFLLMSLFLLSAGSSSAPPWIRIGGSSTLYPFLLEGAQQLHVRNPDLRFAISETGSLGGLGSLCAGLVDIAGASESISERAPKRCHGMLADLVQLEVARDGITLIVSQQNGFLHELTPSELRRIWGDSGKDRPHLWSDIRSSYPSIPIVLIAPGRNSGTFHTFVQRVLDTELPPRRDLMVSENDALLIQLLTREPGGLAMVGYSHFDENRNSVRALSIADPLGGKVMPSPESILNGEYALLSRSLYAYVHRSRLESAAIRSTLHFLLTHSREIAMARKLIPLPERVRDTALEKLLAMTGGDDP